MKVFNSWQTKNVTVYEVGFDYDDLHEFDIHHKITMQYLGSIYPSNINGLNAMKEALNQGEFPIDDSCTCTLSALYNNFLF